MRRITRSILVAAASLAALSLTACGPSIRTAVRYTSAPVADADLKQTRDGLTVELAALEKLPPELVVTLPSCSADGRPVVGQDRQPILEPFALLSPARGEDVVRVTIVNGTDHVLRLGQSVVKLTDPAGNSYELLSKDDLIGLAGTERPCVPHAGASQLRTLKLLDRNVEIMPSSAWKGYAVFGVPTDAARQAGTWKYAFYEMPVKVDETGRPVKTARFEVRFLVKKLLDTYEVGLLGDAKLLSSKEAD